LVPNSIETKPYRYYTDDYFNRKKRKLEAKTRQILTVEEVEDADSSSGDEDDNMKYRDHRCFFDE